MRVTSKAQLLESMDREHGIFAERVKQVPLKLRAAAGVWGDAWSVKDLVLHITAWEQLFLTWYHAGKRGEAVPTPAAGYKWNEVPRLNRDLQKKLSRTSWKRARENFDGSYEEIRLLAKSIDEGELLQAGIYPWTGSSTVGGYLAANTASHYKAGTKILKRWRRSLSKDE